MYYWDVESFGSNCPINYEDILDIANKEIDTYAYDNGDEDDIKRYSEQLFEDFCNAGEIDGVKAIFSD